MKEGVEVGRREDWGCRIEYITHYPYHSPFLGLKGFTHKLIVQQTPIPYVKYSLHVQ